MTDTDTLNIPADPTTNDRLRAAAMPTNIVPDETIRTDHSTTYRGEIYIAAEDLFYTYAIVRSDLLPGVSAAVCSPQTLRPVVPDAVTALLLFYVARDIDAGI